MSPTPPVLPPPQPLQSPNFAFLAVHSPLLVRYAAFAERYVFDDPNTALFKLRQFAELLAQEAAAQIGLPVGPQDDFVRLLQLLRDSDGASRDVLDLFHGLRKAGNAAAHGHAEDRSEALHQLRMARQVAVWFHRSFGDPKYKFGPFLPPPDPAAASAALAAELVRLRQEAVAQSLQAERLRLTAAEASAHREQAEAEAERAYGELRAALELAGETETRLAAERAEFEKRLAEVRAASAEKPAAEIQAVFDRIRMASALVELDEAATRRRIDEQLRDAGWEADSETLEHSQGVRPQKGKNLAIAEWPTTEGPADYVLFLGLTPVAAVEAKKLNTDVAGKIGQAKRYSTGFRAEPGLATVGGPWGEYRLPFCFSTNGRPYLRQLETQSGVWFWDARRPTNLSRALEGWYTPAGLEAMLKADQAAADAKLADEPTDYLPLRDYQLAAVGAIERAIAAGRRAMLVAMATGTGKTMTCLGLIYRLLKSGRFRRVLFLVDRTSLEDQAFTKFEAVRLEGLRAITEIYDVKRLGDLTPDPATRLHFGTAQGMAKRILYADDPPAVPPVDAYDCVVVDECHRGYTIDRELSDAELTFRDEADYISKYRRVLDHFDAVKIGLTATPAQHTVEIFGEPLPDAQYTYRQAVIDGWLVDHEPPLQIVTRLGEDGITWKPGEVIDYVIPRRNPTEVLKTTAPDTVNVEIDEFHKRVITKPYNEVVCECLAAHIDPSLPGKTIVFCVNDKHADLVVTLFKKAFEKQYGEVEEEAVLKITGQADKPLRLIKRFQNERLPSVAVTVDLLTTGIDVPEITNLVFLRRVRSRILYEQMLGRGTRLCPDLHGPKEGKAAFRVFDAVNLYAALLDHTDMRPVVTRPKLSFQDLAAELQALKATDARAEVFEQFVAKLRAKGRVLSSNDANADGCWRLTGMEPAAFVNHMAGLTPEDARDWLAVRPKVPEFLDLTRIEPERVLISSHVDQVIRQERGYGKDGKRPGDYLDSFRTYITQYRDTVAAMLVVARRPRDLTRQQLKELKLALDEAGFTETQLQTAWRETRNEDIAATIIGYVRHIITGEPLRPYKERVAAAMKTVLASRPWTPPQRKWLEKIGKQLETETVVDREAFDKGQFQADGGFNRLNKVFNGELEAILGQIVDAIWPIAA
ncbi:MAG: Type site-specific deoxyribonuclease [Gemmataceae bacterium]|nr:Type site-specific deoxyribonuclease [Gemmataceae bacterium]